MKLCLFALIALLLVGVLNAHPTQINGKQPARRAPVRARPARPFKRSLCSTNAECLRYGLPLLKPIKRGTRTRSAMKPRDSPVADDTFGGIEVFDAAGDSMGYISKNLDEGGYTITTDPTQAVSISFTQDGSNPFSITISSNDRQAGYPYLGATLNTGSDMGVSSAAFANLGGISHIISGPSESDDTGESNTRQLYAGSETAIFLYNADTNAITGQWTNTDNTKVDTIFYFGPKDSYSLGMIAPENYDQFAIDFPEDQQKVTFKYVSIDPTPGV